LRQLHSPTGLPESFETGIAQCRGRSDADTGCDLSTRWWTELCWSSSSSLTALDKYWAKLQKIKEIDRCFHLYNGRGFIMELSLVQSRKHGPSFST
jgi:hypothetical protein